MRGQQLASFPKIIWLHILLFLIPKRTKVLVNLSIGFIPLRENAYVKLEKWMAPFIEFKKKKLTKSLCKHFSYDHWLLTMACKAVQVSLRTFLMVQQSDYQIREIESYLSLTFISSLLSSFLPEPGVSESSVNTRLRHSQSRNSHCFPINTGGAMSINRILNSKHSLKIRLKLWTKLMNHLLSSKGYKQPLSFYFLLLTILLFPKSALVWVGLFSGWKSYFCKAHVFS